MQIAFNSQLNMTNGIINCKKTEHHKKEYLKVWRSIYSILDQYNFIGEIVSYQYNYGNNWWWLHWFVETIVWMIKFFYCISYICFIDRMLLSKDLALTWAGTYETSFTKIWEKLKKNNCPSYFLLVMLTFWMMRFLQ